MRCKKCNNIVVNGSKKCYFCNPGKIQHCYDTLSGYKAARKNPLTDDYNVTYDAELQQVSVSDGHKYITVCEGHNNLISCRTLAQAKLDRFDSTQWCDDCKGLI